MPAIQLAKLKIESAHLAEKFDRPARFVHEFHALCDFYAERTRRPGQTGKPSPLLETYKVPAPVLRQVSRELTPYVEQNNQAALDLADALWAEPFLEMRLLAASLLGEISPEPADRLVQRVQSWVEVSADDRLLIALVETGLKRLRQEETDVYLDQVKKWLDSDGILLRRLGLRALLYLVKSQNFENLPAVIRLVTPLVRSVTGRLRPDLMDVVQALAYLSPKETAFFLLQNLAIKNESTSTGWVIRQSMGCFPPEIQASLRKGLQSNSGKH
jgi:hypothetical protein